MEIKGQFIKLLDTKTGVGKNGNWEAQTFMIEVQGQYPKKPVFELFNNADAIAGLNQGDTITVHFDLDSSEWQGKTFPKVKAFKVVREQSAQPVQQQQPAFQPPAASSPDQGGGDQLPF